MSKLVILDITGDWQEETVVTLEIREDGGSGVTHTRTKGKLPSASLVMENYHQWQSLYRNLTLLFRLGERKNQITNASSEDIIAACRKSGETLATSLNSWLNAESFRPIREKLLEKLLPTDTIRVILQVDNISLQRLPWHLWNFFELYPKAEIALSAPAYERIEVSNYTRTKIRLLAILGNSTGIDIEKDRKMLENLPYGAETVFLVEPSRPILYQQILATDGWDILFFAGHSNSSGDGTSGKIEINPTDSLSIEELSKILKKAIARGLKLAIFNSCDGLGLAHKLQHIYIPQLIVMREPIPDLVAQEFLKHFISAFASGETLYLAVREAREQLQALEDRFPSASALPVICQNPTELPILWQNFTSGVIKEKVEGRKQENKSISIIIKYQIPITLIALSLLAISAIWQWQRAQINERNVQLDHICTSAEELFASNQELESLLESLNGARQLQQSWRVKADTRICAIAALQQAVYGVREYNRLEGHELSVISISFSPDGERIASASDDNTVKLWQKNGKLLATLEGHRDRVRSVAWSPDGKILASGSYDGTVKLWQTDGTPITTIQGHQGKINSVSFSPDSKILASAGADRTIKLWQLEQNSKTGKNQQEDNQKSPHPTPKNPLPTPYSPSLYKTWQAHKSWILDVTFSPDNQTLASASADKTIKIWRLDGTLINTLESNQTSVNTIRFSPDGELLASGGIDGNIKLWKHETNWSLITSPSLIIPITNNQQPITNNKQRTTNNQQPTTNSQQQNNRIWGLAWSPDSQTLAAASTNKIIDIWDRNGNLITTLKGHSSSIYSVSFSPDGKTLASSSADTRIKFWHPHPNKLTKLVGHNGGIRKVIFSPDSETIATASDDNTVKLWGRDGTLLKTFIGHEKPVLSVRFSPNGQIIASASADGTVKLWSLAKYPPPKYPLLNTLKGHQAGVFDVNFSPDGETLVTASEDKTAKIWQWNGKELATLKEHTSQVTAVSFSPDGKRIVTASDDNTVKLWQQDGKLIKTVAKHSGGISDVTFTPDGKTLATASTDGVVKIWQEDGKLLSTLQGHTNRINSLSFSPDGQILASGSADGTVKLWSLQGKSIKTLKGNNGSILGVTFSPDGKTLASATDNNTAILYNLDPEDLLQRGCDLAKDYLQTNITLNQRNTQPTNTPPYPCSN
ncbi:CHAT domain-containing protein [Limnofasciculus baicalensis]|uniref:WD40 domain-containing protein n=1 Tax=Limnofasciculus baicalensis TaxID=3064906 RepID=UPI0035A05D17